MSDNRQSLSDLGALTGAEQAAPAAPPPAASDEAAAAPPPQPTLPETPLREQELDAQGRAYATGRRKDAVARVWLKPGSGAILVNGRDQTVYFARPTLRLVINQPFDIAERQGQYDVVCTVSGGTLPSAVTCSPAASTEWMLSTPRTIVDSTAGCPEAASGST